MTASSRFKTLILYGGIGIAMVLVSSPCYPAIQVLNPHNPITLYPAKLTEAFPDAPLRCNYLQDRTYCFWGNANPKNYGTQRRRIIFNLKDPSKTRITCFKNHCPSVLPPSMDQASPAAFHNRLWLNALWAIDNTTIVAILHNEFHGWEAQSLHSQQDYCPSKSHKKCWYPNSIQVYSHNSGSKFSIQPGNKLAITTPYQYVADGGSSKWHQGIVHTSNILQIGDYLYLWAQSSVGSQQHPQKSGMCLYRTKTLQYASHWRGAGLNAAKPFSSAHFNVSNVNPYPIEVANPAEHICTPNPSLQKLGIYSLSSWTYNTVLKRYIAIGITGLQNNPSYSHQVVVATSVDGYTWSNKKTLIPINWLSDYPEKEAIAYCSIIDPRSQNLLPTKLDRNYQYSGANPWIICIKLNPGGPEKRTLVVFQMRVS